MTLFPASPYKSQRRTINVCGDGANNAGRSVVAARDEAVQRGVSVNGLPIVSVEPGPPLLYLYVIGGPGAFLIPAASYENFADAIVKTLILEIAHNMPTKDFEHSEAVLAKR